MPPILEEIDAGEKVPFITARWLGAQIINISGKVASRVYQPEELLRLPGERDRKKERLERLYKLLENGRHKKESNIRA